MGLEFKHGYTAKGIPFKRLNATPLELHLTRSFHAYPVSLSLFLSTSFVPFHAKSIKSILLTHSLSLSLFSILFHLIS